MSDQTDPQFIQDESGFPVLFAEPRPRSHSRRLPDESRVEIVTPDATSGPAEWGRYHDAVREAARSYDNPQEGDVEHFLNARARYPERVDRKTFTEAVRRQRMADLVDAADHHIRRDGSLPRGARMVRIQAPKGYMRRALRNSSPEEVAHLRHRLTSIGHSRENVDEYLSKRVPQDIWDQAASYEVQFSEEEEFAGLFFDDAESVEELDVENLDYWSDSLVEAFKEFRPEIHIHLETKEQR